MQKIIAVSLSLVVLLNNFQIGISGLSQAGDLLEHIQYHNDKYGDNFFYFLSKHYGELKEDHTKKHKEEHKKARTITFSSGDYKTITFYIFNTFI